MKSTGLALALLAIAALMNSVVAITGSTFNIVTNSYGGSSFVATFVDRSGADEFNQILNFDTILYGDVGEYFDMKCVTELDTDSRRPASARVIATPVTEYRHQTSGYVGFKSAIRLRSGDILGKFKLACSFIPLKRVARGLNSVVYASINTDEGFVTASATINPFLGFAEYFNAFISSTRSNTAPTAFKITKPFASTNGSIVRVQNPSYDKATSGSQVVFKSDSETTSCDAYWDNVLYRDSVTATVPRSGLYVDLKFGSPINTSSEILIYCYSLIGQKSNPFLPAILEISYNNNNRYTFNYAVAQSSADQITFADFLTQTVETSPELLL